MRKIGLVLAGIAALGGVSLLAKQPLAPPQPLGPVQTAAQAHGTPQVTPLPAGTGQLVKTDVDAWLDGFMPYAMAKSDIPGAVVVVVKDGQILTERGFGYADAEKRKPVDPAATLFRPGSISKLFTWTAVMQQVEAGKLDLDADVNQYIDFKIPAKDGKPVTLRQLMTHTAGFEEQAKSIIGYSRDKVPSYDALLKQWVPERVYAPGTTPAYSNYGASLAGYIVSRVSGEPFEAYIEHHIFAPIGMTRSTFRQPLPAALKPLMSKGYTPGGKDVKYEFVGPAPAGSLAATGDDMGKFMIAHLNQGAGLLKPETAKMMHETTTTIVPPLNRMALGFYETNINGHRAIGHGGDVIAFHSDLHIFLDDNVGIFVSVNSPGKEGGAHGLRGALFEQFADRYFPGKPDTRRVPDQVARDHARMMVGHWANSRSSHSSFLSITDLLGQAKVTVDDKGRLNVPVYPSLSGGPRHWVEVTPFVWEDQDSHERVAAVVKDGKVVRFSQDVFSPFMVFDRVPWTTNAAWLLPALLASLAVLLLTVVLWPVKALVRRHFGAKLELAPAARKAHLLSRLAALVILAAVGGWCFLFTSMLSNLDLMSASSDGIVHGLQLLTWIGFVGGFLVLAWNAWTVWTGGRRWPAKTWSIALLLSAFILCWVGFAYHLLSWQVGY